MPGKARRNEPSPLWGVSLAPALPGALPVALGGAAALAVTQLVSTLLHRKGGN